MWLGISLPPSLLIVCLREKDKVYEPSNFSPKISHTNKRQAFNKVPCYFFTQHSYQFFQVLQGISKTLAGLHLTRTIPVESPQGIHCPSMMPSVTLIACFPFKCRKLFAAPNGHRASLDTSDLRFKRPSTPYSE